MKIKFRTWYKHAKLLLKFVSEIVTDTSARFVNYENEIQYPFEVPFIDDDFIVERFTGLCDKTGKEIYEGDIIETRDGRIRIVSWNDDIAGFECKFSEVGSMSLYWSHREGVKVVGNIHQNPEMVVRK